MRRSLTILSIGILGLIAAACGAAAQPASSPSGYPQRATTVGAVAVTATPAQLDASGAAFTVSLDTHSGSLDADLSATSTLQVDGRPWVPAGWDGDPATGHHRKGTLRFTPGGPLAGTVTLTIGGLQQPASFTWDVAGNG